MYNESEAELEKKENEFSISNLLRQYLRYYHIYIYSFLGIGIIFILIYLNYIPQYRISTTIIVKDPKRGETSSKLFNEFDIEIENKNVENEAEIIKSKELGYHIVKENSLHYKYYEVGIIKDNLIGYENLPIIVEILKNEHLLYDQDIDLTLISDKEYKLKDNIYTYDRVLELDNQIEIKIQKTKKNTVYPIRIKIRIENPEEVTEDLRKTITTYIPSKNSSYIQIALLYPNPKMGEKILDALISRFQLENIKESKRINDSIKNIIDKRLELISLQLKDLGNDQQQFKETRKITFLNDDATSYLQEMRNVDDEIIDIRVRLDNINKIDKSINENATVLSLPNVDLNDPVLTSLLNNYNERNNEKESVSGKSGAENPNVISLNNNILKIKNNILENIKVQRERIEKNLQLLNQKKNELNKELSKIPSSERNLIEILREKSIREKIYTYLLEKREEASINDLSEISKTRIIDHSYSSIKPVKPNKKVIFVTYVLLVIIIPTLIIFIYQKFNTKVLSETFGNYNNYKLFGLIKKENDFEFITQKMCHFIEKNQKKVIMVGGISGEEDELLCIEEINKCLRNWEKKVRILDLNNYNENKSKLSESGNQNLFTKGNDIKNKLYEKEPKANKFDLKVFKEIFDESKDDYDFLILYVPPVANDVVAQRVDIFTDLNLVIAKNNKTRKEDLKNLQAITSINNLKEPYIIFNQI